MSVVMRVLDVLVRPISPASMAYQNLGAAQSWLKVRSQA